MYSFDYSRGGIKIRNCKEVCLKPSVLALCQSRNPLWNNITSVTDKSLSMSGPESIKSSLVLVTLAVVQMHNLDSKMLQDLTPKPHPTCLS